MLMFNEKSFAAFQVEGLDERMAAIRADIQPIFQELDTYFAEQLAPQLDEVLHVHIAQHRRRTVHPPENTWSAISRQKRGYKMEAHFQLGLWDDHVFMWVSMIDQPKNKEMMADVLLAHPELFAELPDDTVLNIDHIKRDYAPLAESLDAGLARFKKVKKSEFQIGRVIPRGHALWQDPVAARAYMLETYESLLPLYRCVQI